jgi:CubicO group peptidase (beta-lactamase class C family)
MGTYRAPAMNRRKALLIAGFFFGRRSGDDTDPRPVGREQLQERFRLLAPQQGVEVGADDRFFGDEDDLRVLFPSTTPGVSTGSVPRTASWARRERISDDTRMSSAAVALRTVEVLLRELEAADEFSGVVGLRHGDQELLLDAFGYASRTWNIPTTVETRFDTASITKLFTAVATLQLVEESAFALDTSVIDYLGLKDSGISPAVTPYHLLTHTSGIADDADEEAGERYEDLFVERPNYSVIETADYLPQFVGKPPNFPPGEGCRYCNVGYVLLGLMIERATGSTYRSYVAEHVFAPAGMNRSGFFRMDVVEPDVAEGVEAIEGEDGGIVGWRRNIYSYPPIGGPDGGAHATVGDLLRFHRAVTDGRLLSPALTAELISPKARHSARGAGSHLMGFGFEFETDADGVVWCYWKEGVNVGVSGMLRHYPRKDITFAVLAVGEKAAWSPIKAIDEAVRNA